MLIDQKVLLFGPLLLFLFSFHRIRRIKHIWQAFGNLPTYSVLVSPLDVLSRLLPRIPWISVGKNFGWENVYERQLLLRLSLSYTAHSPCLGIFAVSKSDIVHLRSLLPGNNAQLLLADATAVKVGLGCKRSPSCSIYPFRLSFKAAWHSLRLLRTSKPVRNSPSLVKVLLPLSTMSGESTEELWGQASRRATMSSSGNRQ